MTEETIETATALQLEQINYKPLPEDQYYRLEQPKCQIVIHHTSGSTIQSAIDGWLKDKDRVATPIIIAEDEVMQVYSSKYWAHHLGVTNKIFSKYYSQGAGTNEKLNQQSIPVELVNAGGLTWKNGSWYTWFNKKVDEKDVIVYDGAGFRGYKAFPKYKPKQLLLLKKLLLLWKTKYPHIPQNYKPDMWDMNVNALKGEPGLFTHVCYRPDKSDCHPQPELISMLKTL